MRVSILTFHRAINYGAVLQAYALQTAVQELGADVEIIDYRCNKIEDTYKFSEKMKASKSLKYTVYLLLKKLYPNLKKNRSVNSFVKKYLNLSREYNSENIEDSVDTYDLFLTGSDQVWNWHHTDFDKVFFLDFVKDSRKKYSFAASFGFENLSDKQEEYTELLKSFSCISVREKSGEQIVASILGEDKSVFTTVDPSFLLNEEEWSVVMEQQMESLGDYVLLYELMPSETLKQFALKISKENNYKVVCITNTIMKTSGITYLYGVSPERFLALISKAKCVCTNSFHGTAFSINFNTPFCVELLKGGMALLNTRLENLLTECEAQERIISDHIDPFSMQWDTINENRNRMVADAFDYLRRIIQ